MATRIKLKNSTVLDKAPTTADIAVGELALNCNSGSPAAYIQDSAGGIVQIAGVGSVNTPDATETVKGIAEIATTAEVSAGTNDSTIVTPAKLAAAAPAAQDLQSVCDEGTTTTTGISSNGTITANLFSGLGAATFAGDLTVNTDALFVDASAKSVGIGTTSPEDLLHISDGASGTSETANAQLVLESGASTNYIVFQNPNDQNAGIKWSDAGGQSNALINYDHNTDDLWIGADDDILFAAAGSERMRINSSGSVLIGPSTGAATTITAAGAITAAGDLTVNTDALFVDASAKKVGIGTTSPQEQFVVSNSGAEGLEIVAGAVSNTNIIQNYNRSTSAYSHLRFDASTFNFRIGTSDAMQIDSSGNVGIGTTSPSYIFQIKANTPRIALQPTADSQEAQILFRNAADNSSPGSIVYDHGNSALLFKANGSERMRIDSSGNLGVGTTSPSQKLTVDCGAPGYADKIITQFQAESARQLYIGWDDSQSTMAIGTNNNHPLAFHTNGQNAERMRIDTSGIVLINTTSVGSKSSGAALNLVSGSGGWGLTLRNRSNDDYAFMAFNSYDNSEQLASIALQKTTTNTGDLFFSTNGGNAGSTERMRIDSSGNVGIGTTSPTSDGWSSANDLVINHNTGNSGITIKSGSSAFGQLVFNDAAGGLRGNIAYDHTNERMGFATAGTGDRLIIDSSGNVGIGTTSPSNLLTVGASGGPTVRLTDTTSGVFGLIQSGSNGDFTISADHGDSGASTNILFKSDGATERMRIESDGDLRLSSGTTGADTNYGGIRGWASGTGDMIIDADKSATAGAGGSNLILKSRGAEWMRIDSSGNVGIGTTPTGFLSSGYVLRLNSGGSQTFLALNNSTHTTQATGGFVIGNDTNSAWIVQRENQPMKFLTNDIVRMLIDSSGNVGIGTTSPSTLLHVDGVITATGYNLSSLPSLP